MFSVRLFSFHYITLFSVHQFWEGGRLSMEVALKSEKSTKFGLNHKKIWKNTVSYIDSRRLDFGVGRQNIHHRRPGYRLRLACLSVIRRDLLDMSNAMIKGLPNGKPERVDKVDNALEGQTQSLRRHMSACVTNFKIYSFSTVCRQVKLYLPFLCCKIITMVLYW